MKTLACKYVGGGFLLDDSEDDMAAQDRRKRPEDTDTFLQVADRLQLTKSGMARLLGRSRGDTVKRWFKATLDVEPADLRYLQEVDSFLDAVELEYRGIQRWLDLVEIEGRDPLEANVEVTLPPILPASKELGEEFARLILTFGWSPYDDREYSRPPFFAEVSGIRSPLVRRMAEGKAEVSAFLMDGLRRLAARASEASRAQGEADMRVLLHPVARAELEARWAAEEAADGRGESDDGTAV